MNLLDINVPRLRLGIAALRSGLYPKGAGYLHLTHNGKDGWCCLGVLTDVAIRLGGLDLPRETLPAGEGGCEAGEGGCELFGDPREDYRDQDLPDKTADWYGLPRQDVELPLGESDSGRTWQYATAMNDVGLPGAGGSSLDFSDVADAFARLADQAEAAQREAAADAGGQ
jgi:hypothetical protein